MKPGRELDALIAEKVMGLVRKKWRDLGEDFQALKCSDADLWLSNGERCSLPAYSTDIAAAWEVVEKIQSMSNDGDFHLEHLDGQWSASTCHEKATWIKWSHAETTAHAICLAALKAVSG